MSSPNQTSHQKHLSFICNQTRSLHAQIAWLSLKNSPVMVIHDQILLLLDCIQLLAPSLIFSLFFQSSQESALPQIVENSVRIMYAVSWLSFDKINNFVIAILFVVGLFVLLRSLLFVYIVLVVEKKAAPSEALIELWGYLFRIQGRIMYFVVSSFWLKAFYSVLSTKEERTGLEYYGLMILFSSLLALEFFFSLYLKMLYVDVLPSKQYLSAKNNTSEVIGLVQKLMIQILFATLDFKKLPDMWAFSSASLLFDVMRNIHFYKTLPFYSFKTLFYQSRLLMLITSVNLSCFVATFVRSIDLDSSSLAFVIGVWIILTILLMKSSQAYLNRIFWVILLDQGVDSVNLLIHRINAIRELRKVIETDSWTLLAKNCINSRIKDILKTEDSYLKEEAALDMNDDEAVKSRMQYYLKRLLEIYPHDKFLQLYTAYFYIKILKLIRDPIDLIMKLKDNCDLRIKLNAELLLMEIQNTLKEKYSKLSEDNNHLNLSKFISEKLLSIQAREKIISQANLQIRICNEVQRESPNLFRIFNDSQKLSDYRLKTSRFLKSTLNKISEYHIQPLLLYAKYHLILNHSFSENLQFQRLYTKRLEKYQRNFNQEKLIEENMFHTNVSFVIFSGSKAGLGRVFYASKAMKKVHGNHDDLNIVNNTPPCLYNSRMEHYKELFFKGEQGLYKEISRGFLYTKEGSLVEVDEYMNIHPLVTKEFYLTFLRKEIKSDSEYMYVLENGDIDSTTKGIGLKLGLTPCLKNKSPGTEFNLVDISVELSEINNIFNQVFYAERSGNRTTEHEEAQEVYSLYTISGKNITLRSASFQSKTSSYVYNCKVTNIFFRGVFVKLFTFKEISQDIKETSSYSEIREKFNQDGQSTSFSKDYKEDEFEEKEKEKGDDWIDFNVMNSKITCIDPMNSLLGTTEIVDTQRDKETCRQNLLLKIQDSSSKFKPTQIETQMNSHKIPLKHAEVREELSVASSLRSKLSQQKRVFSLYEASLKTKKSPKKYKLLLCLFYLVFITLFTSQMIMKSILDRNVEDLRLSKDILRNAQLRTSQQIIISYMTRVLWDINSGKLSRSAFGPISFLTNYYPVQIISALKSLSETNQNLLSNSSRLSEDLRQKLFENDVAIYDTYFDEVNQTYDKLNNFQAINRVVEIGLSMSRIRTMTSDESSTIMKFVLRNSLNDLLVKNEEICEIILDYLNTQRISIEANIKASLIAFCSVFAGFLVIGIWILWWKQFQKQMRNLSAFCQLNPKKLNDVAFGFMRFKKAVEEEDDLESHDEIYLRNQERAQVKRDYNKSPNCKELQKSYYLLISKLTLLVLVIIIAIITTSSLNQKSIKSSQTLQEQIFFMDHSNARTGVMTSASFELVATNNTAFIENRLALDDLRFLVSDLDRIRQTIYDVLDSNEDSGLIETILYGDACGVITSQEKSFCGLLQAQGYKSGLVYLLSNYGNVVKAWIQAYEDSNKTQTSLNNIKAEFVKEFTLILLFIRAEFDLLANLIDFKLEENLDYTYLQREYIAIGYSFVIVCVGFLVWRTILRRVRGSINQFKNVLAVLPGEIVLGSFVLRTFLIKTSHGTLDPIKNYI